MGVIFGRSRRWMGIGVLLLLIVSCKATRIASDGSLDHKLSAKTIINEHYANQLVFKTISGRLKIDYSDGEDSQGVVVSFRMEKDSAIWLSAPLGIVKVYITPGRVSFYNKLENEYFDGDYTYLGNLLGTELNFEQVQSLLLGQAIFNLKETKYEAEISGGNYQLKPKNPVDLFKVLFQIEPKHFKMASVQVSQPLKQRLLQVNYKNYQEINKRILPDQIAIAAISGTTRSIITIEYRNIAFDQDLSFPYSIPNGYKEIVLNKNEL